MDSDNGKVEGGAKDGIGDVRMGMRWGTEPGIGMGVWS